MYGFIATQLMGAGRAEFIGGRPQCMMVSVCNDLDRQRGSPICALFLREKSVLLEMVGGRF